MAGPSTATLLTHDDNMKRQAVLFIAFDNAVDDRRLCHVTCGKKRGWDIQRGEDAVLWNKHLPRLIPFAHQTGCRQKSLP